MQQQQNKTALVWFRNNLRVQDNISLFKATNNCKKVVAVYFFDPKYFTKNNFGFEKTTKFRAKFLIESVTNLQINLAKLNIPLLTYFASPEDKIQNICAAFFVDTIFTQKEWTKEETDTTFLVKKNIDNNLKIIEDYDQFLYHPTTVTNNFENIPNIFTVFRKKLEKKVKVTPQVSVTNALEENCFENHTKIPTLQELGCNYFETDPNSAFPFSGGETNALKRIDNYFFESKKISTYKQTRNYLLGPDYSTKLSAWLANGSISAKTIYWKTKEFENKFGANDSTYWVIFELLWRDYFKYISLKHGSNIFKIGGILNKTYHWQNNKKIIQQWMNGETKDDFVNANMIELKETGFLSNRGRQNAASYFAKELLQDWRIGAAYFESLLIDYDVHSNYGNWMYVAGVGNDPRDRKFNTKLQAQRYDANHEFRDLWLKNF